MFAPLHTLVPLAAAAFLLTLADASAQSGSVPGLRCEDDYQDLLAAIARNRDSASAEINRQMSEAKGQQRDHLAAMLEQVWDDEERQRRTADMIRRDCQKAAKGAR